MPATAAPSWPRSRVRRDVPSILRVTSILGEADLRHLLDAQDYLIAAQDAEIVNRQERLDAAILLFKVSCH